MHPIKKTGLLIVICLVIGAAVYRLGAAQSTNMIAVHNKSSPQYNRNCTSCHGQIYTERSLTATPTAHVAMRSRIPGENDSERCAYCHRNTDLLLGSAGNIRRQVDVALCALCHGPSRSTRQYFQSGTDPVRPDGASLYTMACSPCHGSLTQSEVRGESASEIQEEINDNEGGMGPLSILAPLEIQAIAQALAQ